MTGGSGRASGASWMSGSVSSTEKTRSSPARAELISAKFWLMLRIGLVEILQVGEEDGQLADGRGAPLITRSAPSHTSAAVPAASSGSTTSTNRVSVL